MVIRNFEVEKYPVWQSSCGPPSDPVGRPRAEREPEPFFSLLFTPLTNPGGARYKPRRSRRSSFFGLRGSGSAWHLSARGRPTGAGAGAAGALPNRSLRKERVRLEVLEFKPS